MILQLSYCWMRTYMKTHNIPNGIPCNRYKPHMTPPTGCHATHTILYTDYTWHPQTGCHATHTILNANYTWHPQQGAMQHTILHTNHTWHPKRNAMQQTRDDHTTSDHETLYITLFPNISNYNSFSVGNQAFQNFLRSKSNVCSILIVYVILSSCMLMFAFAEFNCNFQLELLQLETKIHVFWKSRNLPKIKWKKLMSCDVYMHVHALVLIWICLVYASQDTNFLALILIFLIRTWILQSDFCNIKNNQISQTCTKSYKQQTNNPL